MVKLRRLELATNYLDLIKVVDQLHNEVGQWQDEQPAAAVGSYKHLREISVALDVAQVEAEGSGSQLVQHVATTTKAARDSLQNGVVKSFRRTIEKMKWPQAELNLLGDALNTWSEQTSLLIELEEADLLTTDVQGRQTQTPVLLPLEIMAEPLAQRFRFHFYGDRPTNRLDKPEYFLTHVFDLLDRFSPFMSAHLQPIIDERIEANEDLEDFYPDAVSLFISSLLPMIETKCLSLLSQISSQPQLFSHFMKELMSFDETLRDTWHYSPSAAMLTPWKGLTWLVLDHHAYFDQWLKVEKDFALSRYRSIRDASDSGDIDYEGVNSAQTKPTKGTARVNDILETITDRYRGLSSFSQKIKFLMGIQISIFDDYHSHLFGSLQAYIASSHTAGRLLQGQYSKHEAFDHRALSTLCKVYGSAEFLERKMLDWGDDIFFLELWDELQERARGNSDGHVGKDLRVDDVAARTSSTIQQHRSGAGDENEGGTLFDETASSYHRLRESAEREILRLLDINIKEAIAPFARLEAWASMSTVVGDPSALSPSSALDTPLQVTSVLLGFLAKVLARPSLRRLVKHYCHTLQSECIGSVLLAHNFSTAGIAQLKRDILALEDAIESTSGIHGVAQSSFRKLHQATELLALPIKGYSAKAGHMDEVEGEDAWGFDEDETAQDIGAKPVATPPMSNVESWSLWEAEKEIFRSNEAARQALSDMGFDLINELEARSLLKRRVELNG